MALAAAAFIAQPAAAAPVVDQAQDSYAATGLGIFPNLYGWDRAVSVWQSYTAGLDGQLMGINLRFFGPLATADLKIYAGEGVDGTLLSTTHLTNFVGGNGSNYVELALAAALEQHAGLQYTFALENLSCPGGGQFSCGGYRYANSDAYAGGKFMAQGYYMPNAYHAGVTNADLSFQTLVERQALPEPGTLSILALALAGAGFASRRRRA